MRCFFTVEMDDGASHVMADASVEVSSRESAAEAQFGAQFRDWLLAVIGRGMHGDEDRSVDILSGKAPGRRRVVFSYRRNRREGVPFWSMSVPGDVLSGKCPDAVRKVFRTLAMTFAANPLVRPDGPTSSFTGATPAPEPPQHQEKETPRP